MCNHWRNKWSTKDQLTRLPQHQRTCNVEMIDESDHNIILLIRHHKFSAVKYIKKKLDDSISHPFGYFYLLYKLHKNPSIKKNRLIWLCQLTSCTLNVGWWNASTNCHKSTHMFQRLIYFEMWSQLPDVTRKCKFTHTWCSVSTWTLILRLTQPIVLPNCSPIFLTRPNTIN